MTIAEVAECVTAVGAIVGIAAAFMWRRHDINHKRRVILVEFMQTTYSLNRDKDKLLREWHQIRAYWDDQETMAALAALRKSIEEFHVPYNMPPYHHQLTIYSAKQRALKTVNDARTNLCGQMHNEMKLLQPSLDGIAPFEAIIRNPL